MTVTKFQTTDDVVWEVASLLASMTRVQGITISMDEIVDSAYEGVMAAKINQDYGDPSAVLPESVTPHDLGGAVQHGAEALVEIARRKLAVAGYEVS